MVSVTLVLGAGDFALSLGGFTLGGIGTATFGAILLHALDSSRDARGEGGQGNAGVSHISAALAQGAVWAWVV
ncbi:Uracil permease [Klebsiella pneumoniae]|uniref:Uracil permease n=1 Tax=Klebsiella pneumoniae TaxID=573 RepID=A0A377WIH1_KLEPN|nr:Uracil permease [Klebsiella pneumoniae]